MALFFNRFAPIIGLQLNGGSVKCIELGHRADKKLIRACGYAALPKNVIANDIIIGKDALAKSIQAVLKAPLFGSFSTTRVAVSLPEARCFVRVIQLPLMTDEEVANAILYESEAYIPLPMDQVYFDWQIIKRGSEKMDVIVLASPKNLVDGYISVLESAGLRVVAIETESKSLERALVSVVVPETVLVVDFDMFRTSLLMVEEGNAQFTSSIPIAGNTFTERIAQSLGITTADAEIIKRQAGLWGTPEYPTIKTILLPLLGNLTAEIQNIIQYHYEHSGERIQKIILSGGGAKMKNLPEFLAGELKQLEGTKIEVANPWQNLKHAEQTIFSRSQDALDFVVPIGLSMRSHLI